MLALRQTLDQTCWLLQQLPEVTLLDCELGNVAARIKVTHSNEDSVHALQLISLGANVALEPWIHISAEGDPVSLPIEQNLIARSGSRGLIEFGELQLLGIHLAWHLHKIGLLTTTHANSLLGSWRADTVGA